MKPASSFLALFLIGSLMAEAMAQVYPIPGHRGQGRPHAPQQPEQWPGPQRSQVISERVMQNIGPQQRLPLSGLLRLSPEESHSLSAKALTLVASSTRGQAQIEILSLGRPVGVPQLVRRQLSEIRIPLALGTQLADLEILTSQEILLDTITVEVEQTHLPDSGPGWQMQPRPGEVLKLDVRREVRGAAEISLGHIISQQHGLILQGAQIQRVVLLGSLQRGYSATAQLLLNDRLVGPMKSISSSLTTPIPVRSIEEVQTDLRLLIRGNVLIQQVNVVIGNVREIPHGPHGPHQLPQRIHVG